MIKSVSRHIILLFLALSPGIRGAERLYVFYPTMVRSQVLQKEFSKTFAGVDVIVFGKYGDFRAKIAADSSAAVLTRPALIDQLPGYEKRLTGVRDGKTEEAYRLVSVGKPVKTDSLGSITIGVLDFLGKQGMEEFVSSMTRHHAKVKRVMKLEDLLPLLTFEMAQAILVTDEQIALLKKTSNLDLIVTQLPGAQSGIIALGAQKSASPDAVIKALRTQTVLGVQQWK